MTIAPTPEFAIKVSVLLFISLLLSMLCFAFILIFKNVAAVQRWHWRHIFLGATASMLLLAAYGLLASTVNSPKFAMDNFRLYWYLFVPLVLGVGAQVSLFSYMHSRAAAAPFAATGTVSSGTMLACCAHLLVGIIPLVGVSTASMFITNNQPLFLAIGIASNLAGIAYMLKTAKVIKWKTSWKPQS